MTINETSRTQMGNPPAYSQFITNDLPEQINFLSLFAIGQSYFVNNDYSTAENIIEQAVDSVKSTSMVEGLADAYFRIGWLNVALKENPEKAIYAYSKAIYP